MVSLFFILTALTAASSTLAAPVGQGTSGALFFMTNDPSGNELVVSSLGTDGKATFVTTVPTGGKGATGHGGGPDALFSQDSVLVAKGGMSGQQNLFVVNPGSNTVSAFALNNRNPTSITQIGKPVNSGGEFPVAIARSPSKHHQVCVLNGGAINGVSCFHMNHLVGLKPLANSNRRLGLNQTTPATGPAGSVSDITFSEDGKMLLVSVKGAPPTPGFVAKWDVADDGSLSQNFTPLTASAGGLPFGMSLIPGKNALLATDPAVGASTFSLSLGAAIFNSTSFDNSTLSFNNNTSCNNSTDISSDISNNSTTSGSVLTQAIPISGQGAVCWSARSQKTGSFFVTDILTSMVTEIAVDDNLQGSIVKQYQQTNQSGTIDDAIGTIGGNDYLYVLATNTTSPQIDILAVGDAPGQAQNIQTLDIGADLTKSNTKFTNINLQGMAVFVPGA
ncbi:hypothetical protein DL93DRAFT_2162066 [Clavulina sp. PMI_390]|nr:hypothetical protein DL93DRAFT_2162066 [Clavulina sp. PMI_390]